MSTRGLRATAAFLLSVAATIASLPARPVLAAGPAVLEEIVVTARKREESLQDVAMSVSAMGQREIEANFATDLRDLVYISPNLVLDDTNQGPGGVAAAYIRGIGVSEVEKNFDPAVGVVVDGLFLGTMSGSITRAIDLESVEVLRGPQGTLFGRNTIGGVIKVERSKPTKELGGKVRASYGDYDTTTLDGLVNFGNGENFGIKLTGTWRKQDEGYYRNLFTGRKDGQSEYLSGGVNLLFEPVVGLELEWTSVIERTDQDSNQLLNVGQPGQLFCDVYGWCSPDTRTPVSGDRYAVLQAYNDFTWPFATPRPAFDHDGKRPDKSSFDTDTHKLDVRWQINDSLRFDYIGGLWQTDEKVITDWDAVPDLLFHTDRPADYEQFTNELRLTYDAGGAISGTAGLYTWDSEYEIPLVSWIAFVVPGTLLAVPQTTKQESDSWAIFFEGDWTINDQWTVTLGGRYTEDEKTTTQRGNVPCGQSPVLNPEFASLIAQCSGPFDTSVPIKAKQSWNEFTPKVAVRWAFSDAGMAYFLYSRGYRAGGFNGRVDSIDTAITPYDPETVDNFELGLRTEWLDRRLILNGTVFYMDYKDKQEEIQQPSTTSGTGQVTRVVNASTAQISGVELEAIWLAVEGLTLRANLGILDASYDQFLVDVGTPGNPVLKDFSNLDIRRAPDVTGAVVADYEKQWGPGNVLLHAGARYLGSHEVDFANKPELHNDAQWLVDASLTYEYQQFYGSVYGRNLLEEDGYQIGFDVAGLWSYASTRPPRTWGVEIGMRFGQ
ncbi:MAG: TonB-dependent receptor [Gammaproteobacteria bacterium]|nr:MAG: TonB-dependent receptor [Gammaproteobacteria bacterium]